MNLRCCLPLLLAAVLAQTSAFAAGLILVSDPAQPDRLLPFEATPRPRPGFVPPPPGLVLELVSHRVEAQIKDQFALTRVVQEFRNPTGRRLEGVFLFPAPKGAQLRKFTMDIDGKPAEAELLTAEKARGIYEDIVRRQRDPALLEFIDRDLYRVRIFPIEPRATRRVALSYEQVLKSEAGLVRFVYPMAVEKFSAKPIDQVALKIELSADRPLKSIYSPTHEVSISRPSERWAVVGYETSGSRAEHDFELFFSRENEGVGMSLLAYRDAEDEDGYFLLLASPGLVADRGKVLPKDVVFVIDTSGSMAGGKLDQARKALSFCVENLNEGDRFEIVRFSTDIEPLFKELAPADGPHRRRAGEFIARLKPLGGTAIDDALQQALKLPGLLATTTQNRPPADARFATSKPNPVRPQVIVFLTDGLPTVGETNIDRIVANVTGGASVRPRIFCFGIGTDVNTHLLDRITEATRAASEYVLPTEDLEVKVSSFFAKIKDPILTGVTVQLPETAGASRILPARLPDLFSGEQLLVVGRYARAAGGAVKLTGSAGGSETLFAEDVSLPGRETVHEFIPRLWATRRIGWLLDEIRLRGESAELKEEVTTLARRHGIVTPYTAWLIVEDEERRRVRPDLQTLRSTPENRRALEHSRDSFSALGQTQTGVDSTLSSRYGAAAREAKRAPAKAANIDAPAYDAVFLQRYGLDPATSNQPVPATPSGSPAALPSQPQQKVAVVTPSQLTAQAQVVAGKTFYEKADGWVDADVQQHPKALRVKLVFGSAEYFQLLRQTPALAKWLAAGRTMQIYYAGTIYEVIADQAP